MQLQPSQAGDHDYVYDDASGDRTAPWWRTPSKILSLFFYPKKEEVLVTRMESYMSDLGYSMGWNNQEEEDVSMFLADKEREWEESRSWRVIIKDV